MNDHQLGLPCTTDQSLGQVAKSHTKGDHVESLTKDNASIYRFLQYKQLVPSSTIRDLVLKFKSVYDAQNIYLTNCLRDILLQLDLDCNKVQEILDRFSSLNYFSEIHESGPLRLVYAREKFYSESQFYVRPVAYVLNSEVVMSENCNAFHYIPLLESIKNLFRNDTIRKQFSNPEKKVAYFSDLNDGLLFQRNPLFRVHGNKAIQIVLYQDDLKFVIHWDREKVNAKF